MKKGHKMLALAIGAASVVAYRAVKGKGAFNKLRFADQHEAVGRYIDSHHPGAVYSGIEQIEDGWTCIITDGEERFLLYLTMSEEGIYIFEENRI